MSFEILLAIALIPPILLLFIMWRVDKLEHEPIPLLLIVAGLGALSGLLALVLEIALDGPIASLFESNYAVYLVADNFVGVALMEELSKMLVVMLVVWRHKQFNCRFDGVVYGAASSLGFAALENVKYVLSYGFETGLVRAFTAIPGHLIFGIFMGAFIGMAKCSKYAGKKGKMNLQLFCAILVPTLIHGYYDYLLSVPDWMGNAYPIWIGFLIAMVISAIIVIIVMAKRDRLIDPSLDVNGEAKPNAAAAGAIPTAVPVATAIPYAQYGTYQPTAQAQAQVQVQPQTQAQPYGQVTYVPGAYMPDAQAAQQAAEPTPQPAQVYVPQSYQGDR